jgi:chromosome partitioning protein
VPQPKKQVFAIANQKGGVGKTTTTINLGACLGVAGRRVLIVDLDPQSNTTTGLGLNPRLGETPIAVDKFGVEQSIYELLVQDDVPPSRVLKRDLRPELPNLAVLPAKVDLYAAEIELVYIDQREFRLKRILDGLKAEYDFVLIDCPPSLGLLTVNALTAADGVILPLQCEYFALEGMAQLLKTIKLVRDRLNPALELFGVVLTMFDSRTKLSSEVVDEISRHFTKEKFNSIIPRTVRLAEAPSFGKTILEHDPRNAATLAYNDLAEEVIARVEELVRV